VNDCQILAGQRLAEAGAGLVGAIALYATPVVGGLGPLLAVQFVAGGA